MRRLIPGKKAISICALGLVLAGGLVYWQSDRLLAWHYVRQLAQANEEARAEWISRVVALGEPCVPGLVERLRSDEKACGNMEEALVALAAAWGTADARTEKLLLCIQSGYSACAPAGKCAGLRVVCTVLKGHPCGAPLPAGLAKVAVELLTEKDGTEVLRPALRLARALLERVPAGQGTDLCRGLALKGLEDPAAATRLAAVQVMLQAPFKQDQEMLRRLIPFLKDEAAELRKAALLALASERDLVGDDDLLPFLHDASAEVREVCELALRSRGLQDHHILLAGLISDESPAARLQVLDHLHRASDLEPGVWLERLTRDPSPAVRAAAIRAAAKGRHADLSARILDMARKDTSPSVRQLAVFYATRTLRPDD